MSPLPLLLAAALMAPSLDEPTPAAVRALSNWVGAIQTHQPGDIDASVRWVWAATVADREAMDDGMKLFLAALSEKPPRVKTPEMKAIADLARAATVDGIGRFLKRAAVLHSDAAIAVTRRPPLQPSQIVPLRSTRASPLFPAGRLLTDADGQIVGSAEKDWNWSFARSLMDIVASRGQDEAFVSQWYHATTSVMFRRGAYGEAGEHLARAAAVLVDDPRLLYDRGCLSEFNGLPVSQVLLSDEDLAALRGNRFRQNKGLSLTAGPAHPVIPLPEVANAEAADFFRRAIARAPGFSSAHVRLARVLLEKGDHEKALVELELALVKPEGPVTAFLAHLFAGRAHRLAGRLPAAAGHYRAALALFPDAQSALLGASQVALLQGNLGDALVPIRALETIRHDPERGTDPWWHYRLGPGIWADSLWTQTIAMLEGR